MTDKPSRKPKYWSRELPEGRDGPWDTIVIGSGMGGMTTAAALAKLGERVLVLEQHYVPGGFTHAFTRKGYTWDVGVHAVGEVTKHSLPGRVLARLTDDRLEWASLGPVYDEFHFPGGFRIDFPDSPQQFRDNLVAAFPNEVAGIERYLAAVREVAGSMRNYYLSRIAPKSIGTAVDLVFGRQAQKYLTMNTAKVVSDLTTDEHLRTVLCAQWGYYGSTPEHSSFAIQALVTKHFLWGAYYPVGGSGEIARQLLRTVADAGGWTRIYADVKQILVEGGRAVGVTMKDDETIRAGRVVSAAGVLSTVDRLLPPGMADAKWTQELRTLNPAPAHVCLYIGFKGDIREAGAGPANKWFYDVWSSEDDVWRVDGEGPLDPAGVLYCSFPSLKDPTHDPGPEVRHTGEVVTFVPWETFEPFLDTRWKRRGDAYDALKQKMQDALLDQFLQKMPGLAGMVDYVELSTPLSTHHFTRPMRGSIYGIEPTPERFENPWLRPRSPVPGLFFSGSEVASVGVVGALMGGLLAAGAVHPVKMARMLRQV